MHDRKVDRRPAAFFDRDGVLIEDSGYVSDPSQLVWLPETTEVLSALHRRGYLLIVVTNQSGIARGKFSAATVEAFHRHMQKQLRELSGVEIDGFFFCPHHPEGVVAEFTQSCRCRKPEVGLIEQAQQGFSIDMQRSFLVGDKPCDIGCGRAVGLPSYQILSSNPDSRPDSRATHQLQRLSDILEILEANH